MIPFGSLFDLNRDGDLDALERAAESQFINDELLGDTDLDDLGETDFDDKLSELEALGLDMYDLELMDEEERKEALESAGLNPEDYDFWI